MNLLIQDTPHVFSPHLAEEIGLHECLMIQQLHWLIQNNDCKYHDGNFWWKHTNAQWLNTLPYFQNEKRVLKTVKSLRSQNLLIAETLTWKIEKIRGDRTLWYRVNYQEVERLSKEIETRKLQKKINKATAKNEPTDPAVSGNSQNGSMGDTHFGSMTHTQNGRMIKKIYKEDLLVVNADDSAVADDFNLILSWILVQFEKAGLDLTELDKGFVSGKLEAFRRKHPASDKADALSFVEQGLTHRLGIKNRSAKAGAARDKLNGAVVNQLNTQTQVIEQHTRNAEQQIPKTTADRMSRDWADGLEFNE